MMLLVAVLSGTLLAGGIALLAAGLRANPERVAVARPRQGRPLRVRWAGLSSGQKARIAAAVVAGIGSFAITQWVLVLVLVPAAILGLPWLLSAPPDREVEVLAALDRWVRNMSSTLSTGQSIKDAIHSTRQQVPETLQRPVQLLLARLNDHWPTRDAFFAMADDIDSPDADAILAALAMATERGGTGATDTLEALAASIHERLHAAREIATERAKPRVVVRQVTIISTVVVCLATVFGGQFLQPYRTPTGMLILASLLAAYVGSLFKLRRMVAPPRRDRLLVRAVRHG